MDRIDVSDDDPGLPRFAVRSWFIDGLSPHAPVPFTHGLPTTPQEFISQLPAAGFSCWVRHTSGLVGFGRAARLTATGARRFADLDRAWQQIVATSTIDDPVGLPGSGLACFSAVTFSAQSQATSVIDIPRYLLGRRDGRVWLTSIEPLSAGARTADPVGNGDGSDDGELVLAPTPIRRPVGATRKPGHTTGADYLDIVAQASALMREQTGAQALKKVVLARDELIETPDEIDVRALLAALNTAYPGCWTFDVAGLIGATPELLVGVEDGRVTTRVLAGTYRVEDDPRAELAAARELLGKAKDQEEHRYAIESIVAPLTRLTDQLHVDEEPHLLQLANVIHLASDAHGTLTARDGRVPTALAVAEAVHPTAAIGGVPTPLAAATIAEYERTDRGRFSGPVGWMDAAGNGQFGIALRCGQFEARNRIRLFAGAGIMPDSDPLTELVETGAKFAPMRTALGIDPQAAIAEERAAAMPTDAAPTAAEREGSHA